MSFVAVVLTISLVILLPATGRVYSLKDSIVSVIGLMNVVHPI